ncbi:MAG: hypothetical protein K9N47_08775 [Prosthecobacter sp.]|uniref:hypothetical protein n=1 Tax=Prosthecobacter sp. TaxID=1965333 RepID=UPI0025E76BEC|nr:hypothetical protein [Prosthecobacter sp.]MCF7786204.1 hypothetical protein [Prosthecobacter sp.]
MKADPEQTLRQMRWRDPPTAFLERVLEEALEASRQRPGVLQPSGAFREPEDTRRHRKTSTLQHPTAPARKSHVLAWLAFIPRPLRLPLAACWLLAFFFRITTPEAIPQSTLNNYAKLPPITPAQLLANLKQIEQLADELLHPRHQGPIPPL